MWKSANTGKRNDQMAVRKEFGHPSHTPPPVITNRHWQIWSQWVTVKWKKKTENYSEEFPLTHWGFALQQSNSAGKRVTSMQAKNIADNIWQKTHSLRLSAYVWYVPAASTGCLSAMPSDARQQTHQPAAAAAAVTTAADVSAAEASVMTYQSTMPSKVDVHNQWLSLYTTTTSYDQQSDKCRGK